MDAVIVVILMIEWALTTVEAAACVLAFGAPWRKPDRQVYWHLSIVTALAGLEALTLFLVAARPHLIPLVLFAILYGLGTAAMGWRLWLVLAPRLRKSQLPR